MITQSKNPGLTLPPDEVVRDIRKTSDGLGTLYSQPKELVYKIIVSLVKEWEVKADGVSYSYPWQIEGLLSHIHAKRILPLLRSEGAERFTQLLGLIAYVDNPLTPIYALDELTRILLSFRRYVDDNGKAFIDTGYPVKLFTKSRWLNARLNKLYFTRAAEKRKRGTSLEYSWMGWSSDRDEVIRNCRYKDAYTVDPELKENDVLRIEELRCKVHTAKLNALLVLISSLKSCSIKNLWPSCLDAIRNTLSDDENKFLRGMDEFYVTQGLMALKGLVWRTRKKYNTQLRRLIPFDILGSGGLFDIFEVIGHVEQEIRCGTHEKIREELNGFLAKESFYHPRIDMVRFLSDVIFSGRNRRDKFFNSLSWALSKYKICWEEYDARLHRDLLCEPENTGSAVRRLERKISEFMATTKTRMIPRIKESEKRRIGGKKRPIMKVFKAGNIIVCRDGEYRLPPNHFSAVIFIIKQHKEGASHVDKYAVYQHAFNTSSREDIPSYVLNKSVREWFISSGGEAKKFAKACYIKTSKPGCCCLSIPIEAIEIISD